MSHNLTDTELIREFWNRHWDATSRSLAGQIERWLEDQGEDPDLAPHHRTLHEWKRKLEADEKVNPSNEHTNLVKRILGYEVRDTLTVPPEVKSEDQGAA